MIVGVGCDIVKLSRVEELMKKDGFIRILTIAEQAIFEQVSDIRRLEWFAGRFAAKEAIIKAFASEQSYLLSDIAIVYEGKRPICNMDGYRIHVSIAHEKDYAIAYATIEREG